MGNREWGVGKGEREATLFATTSNRSLAVRSSDWAKQTGDEEFSPIPKKPLTGVGDFCYVSSLEVFHF